MKKGYYNTNKEKGAELKETKVKALTQEDTILELFIRHKKLSASEAWEKGFSTTRTPITSVRRAITNLCSNGELTKTDKMKKGIYGKNEHIYSISNNMEEFTEQADTIFQSFLKF